MQMNRGRAYTVAFCSLMAALGAVMMLTGGLVPVMTYCSPLLAGVLLIPVLREHGRKWAWLVWIVTAALSMILSADKEAAFFAGNDQMLLCALALGNTFSGGIGLDKGLENGKLTHLTYSPLRGNCASFKALIINGKKTVLYCVITRVEVPAIKKIINDADVSAFMTISDVSEIIGKHIKRKKSVERKTTTAGK